MKILHTADLHLKDTEHLNVVRAILRTAQENRVELVIIAGDMFDAAAHGRSLEAALLPLWQNFPGTVLVVPGNHDWKFLQNRRELADNVIIAAQVPYSVCELDGIYFVCVPYQEEKSLADIAVPYFEPAVLITHGTYGSSDSKDYFPILASDLAGRYRYTALGHYHTWFDKWIDGSAVVNPGAPRQTRKSDKGPRYVSLIDTDTWQVERIILPVSFAEQKTVAISVVDSERDIAEKLYRACVMLIDYPWAEVELKVTGSLIFSKYSLSQRVNRWISDLEFNQIDINRITWNLAGLKQISREIMYSSFAKSMIEKISAEFPQELNLLAPFLLERLQSENERLVD